jgi:GNAT superfamily N-acetyltransferase
VQTSEPISFRGELIDPRRSRDLRRMVLRPDAGPNDPLPGDEIENGVHIGAFVNIFQLASTCFIFPDPCPWRPAERPAWHLRQMATHPDFRGLGAGAAVMRTVVDYIAATGGGLLWCNAREVAVGFYRGQGWQIEGDRHQSGEPPIPHFYMWRYVEAKAPELS